MTRLEKLNAALRSVNEQRRSLDARHARLCRLILKGGRRRFSKTEHICPKCGESGSVMLDFLTRTRRCQWCQWQWWMDASVCCHCLGTRVVRPPGETLAVECLGCKGVVVKPKRY